MLFLAEICLYLSESIPWIILSSLKYWQGVEIILEKKIQSYWKVDDDENYLEKNQKVEKFYQI